MTRAARTARWERLRSEALARNPDLRGEELEAAARLLMRAEMAKLSLRRWPSGSGNSRG